VGERNSRKEERDFREYIFGFQRRKNTKKKKTRCLFLAIDFFKTENNRELAPLPSVMEGQSVSA